MASLAAVYNRFLGAKATVETAASDVDPDNRRFVVRALPNEQIYLFRKDIDNSRVVREADPQARGAAWRLIVSGGITVALLIGVLLPGAYSKIAGYRIQALKAEQHRLVAERSALELEEARLLSPERLAELARAQQFVDPAPQKVVYLDAHGGSLALNVKQ
jgi:cell division protein FtsL